MLLIRLLILLVLVSCQSFNIKNIFAKKGVPSAPKTPKKTKEIMTSLETRIDNYDWLRNKKDSEVKSYLLEEKEHFAKVAENFSETQQKMISEIKSRVDLPKQSLIQYIGEWEYFHRYKKGSEYPIYYRRKKGGEEEVILNVEKMAEGKSFINVSNVLPSPDHKTLAYSVDYFGRRIYEIHFVDLKSGKDLPVKIKGVTPQFEWANDNQNIFYIKQDLKTLRWNQLWRFSFSDLKANLVFEEINQEYYLYLRKSNNGKVLFLTSESSTTSEVSYINTSTPSGEPKLIQSRIDGVLYYAYDGGDRFYLRTNYRANNFKIVKVVKKAGELSFQYWKDINEYDSSEYLKYLQVYEDFIVAEVRKDGLNKFKVISRTSKLRSYDVDFDQESYYASLVESMPYNSGSFRYRIESVTTPREDIEYQVFKREDSVVREQIIPYFSSSNYKTETLEVKSFDDQMIPVTVVYHSKTQKSSETPLLLYAYGSYGFTYEAFFDPAVISLIDRGFIFAIAHVRGGSKKGYDWYLDGKMLNKKNTFKDFISVAYDLIGKNYTSPNHLYAQGKSAGGLLIGAVINEKPELFNGVVAEVPFVDVLNTMLDSSIPLTTVEYQEWGNPNKTEYYEYIKSYSPYDNIKEQKYPHVLATAFWQDSQVQYWEPAKWVAKLREYNKANSMILLDMNFNGGHGGVSGRVGRYYQKAKTYSFLHWLESR